ncbi:T9SS type A sorting domain-containing protein [uncultured Planktosalinus sp.]|uniref:T9SS type A sorting domain-containing protein n=1 Tax=uncultured Planktosalinus sp. TaxID=1810935 RepID=UPI0030D8D855
MGIKTNFLNKIAFFWLVFSAVTVSSQNYTPLLNDVNEWQFTSCFFGCTTDVYFTDGDTIVNTKTYKVLDGYHYINRNLLLRENISEKKVYITILEPQFTEDLLLYDFSMEVGDTIEMLNPVTPFPNNGGYYILDSILNLPLVDGNEYRHFYFSPTPSNTISNTNAIWVEGMGSLSMINAPGGKPDINGVGKVSCFFKNAELFYSDLDSIDACEPFLNMDSFLRNELKIQLIYENQKNHFTLTYAKKVSNLTLFDLSGKEIQSLSTRNQNTIHLDLSAFKPGLYILKAVTNDYKQQTFKVLLQ